MKECKECCREITDEEFKKNEGLCSRCLRLRKYLEKEDVELEDEKNNNQRRLKNGVAQTIKVLSILTALCGVFIGFSNMDELGGIAIIIIVGSIISAIFIYGFGEIIQKLEDIYWEI